MANLTILHIDSSARTGISGQQAHGSHTRRLGARFLERWRGHRPRDTLLYRDLAQKAPAFVTGDWIAAAFTPAPARDDAMREHLAESDALVDELYSADIIVIGVPMYNFGVPAPLKSYVDNIVRVGRTFGFDRDREGLPYWPMLAKAGKRLVLLGARGDGGYEEDARLAQLNHAEPALRAAFGYIGITDVAEVAVAFDEFADERLRQSLAVAERRVDQLVDAMTAQEAA